MSLELKNRIIDYLVKNTPTNFKHWEYYRYYTTQADNYFGSGHHVTSLAICLFRLENNTKPSPKNVLKFIINKFN